MHPLLLRCAKFRFKPIPAEGMADRSQEISNQEGISVDRNTLIKISELFGGDVRKGILLSNPHRRFQGVARLNADFYTRCVERSMPTP